MSSKCSRLRRKLVGCFDIRDDWSGRLVVPVDVHHWRHQQLIGCSHRAWAEHLPVDSADQCGQTTENRSKVIL